MDSLKPAIDGILQLLIALAELVIAAIVTIEIWLRTQLGQFHLPPEIQTIVLFMLAVALIIGALKLFSGLIRLAMVLILALIAIHIVMPLARL